MRRRGHYHSPLIGRHPKLVASHVGLFRARLPRLTISLQGSSPAFWTSTSGLPTQLLLGVDSSPFFCQSPFCPLPLPPFLPSPFL